VVSPDEAHEATAPPVVEFNITSDMDTGDEGLWKNPVRQVSIVKTVGLLAFVIRLT
jgi:hypothetical protein